MGSKDTGINGLRWLMQIHFSSAGMLCWVGGGSTERNPHAIRSAGAFE
jgi:hypothetical protein